MVSARKVGLWWLIWCCLATALPFASAQETIVTNGASWSWRRGTNEVSNPVSAWRTNGFNISSWPVSNAPFSYGEGLATGTVISGMSNVHSCIFLRTSFVLSNVIEVTNVQFVANYDDGFVAWINGTEVARMYVTNLVPYYTNVAAGTANHEGVIPETISVTNPPASYLINGTNILAVQAFNSTIVSADFRFETLLQVTRSNFTILAITNVVPAANSAVPALSQIVVAFNKSVQGVEAADLLLNDQPATAVTGGGGVYTFTVPALAPGPVAVVWDEAHGITDLNGNAFDVNAAGSSWGYTLVDTVAPTVGSVTPVVGAQIGHLTQVEVVFSEPVTGVNAADLQINGSPATDVTGAGAGPYVFQFPEPSAGTVTFSWAAGHGIADTASSSNAFVGGSWSVLLAPGIAPGDVIINEFVAGNVTGLMDEDSTRQDWVELYNRGTNTVNLLGWSLTDDSAVPGKWVFPATNLAPGQFLVVFASEKDRRVSGNRLHTNFKLNLFGEYLALFNAESPRVVVDELAPKFPEQRNDYSYGLDPVNNWRYYATPTPGASNGSSTITGIVSPPHFSVGHGCFSTPFDLVLSDALPGATIRYTTDGSEPTLSNGQTYSTPLTVTNTAIFRAVAFSTDYLPSRTVTRSYIYLDAVLSQPNNPPGFTNAWGVNLNFNNVNVPAPYFVGSGIIPAYYEVDLDPLRVNPYDSGSAIDSEKLQRMKSGLRELPVVSLVLNRDDMFGTNGLYPKSSASNKTPNEKAVSLEMLPFGSESGFTVDGGLGLHGNASRDPFKNPKHPFKISLSGDYGETTLDYRLFPDSPATRFDDIVIRADFGGSWRHQNDDAQSIGNLQRTRASRFRDAWMKQSQRDMGGPSSYNRYCHFFINGLYWGIYDFSDIPSTQFAADYLTPSTNSYDIVYQSVAATNAGGDYVAYNAMTNIVNLGNNSSYETMKQYLNIPEYSDYMLLCFWAGAQDWGSAKNWYAVRPRIAGPAGVFQYIVWDGENVLLDETVNKVPNGGGGNTDVPSGLFVKLDDNAQFRLDFADRVHKHMIAPGGALTREAATARWQYFQNLLDKPIVAESCRWGDYRRSVHRYSTGTFDIYTRENQWLTEMNRITNSYFVNRPANMLGWLRTAGLYPALDAPEYRQATTAGTIVGTSTVAAGYVVALNNPGGGTIYYTTNGGDPRVYYSGTVASNALTSPLALTLNSTTTLKSRVLSNGVWSALNEATFTVAELTVPLRITELMYNPIGGDAYEFVEIQNVGANALNIGGYSFDGIIYTFPVNTILQPGATLLLANSASPSAFATRYPAATVFGYFGGNLSNGGERIAILDAAGKTVTAVSYDDEGGWPTSPDGLGYSLEVIDPRGDQNSAANWRASSTVNGTPNQAPVAPALGNVVINEVAADNAGSVTNGGLFPDWIELYNRSGSSVSLASWSLSDGGNARKYVFPSTNLPAGGYLVVWCDTATNAPGLHSGFALGKGGELISLYDASTNRVDAIAFGQQITDLTLGRIANQWQLTTPTPGASNVAVTLASVTNLVINEWLADAAPGSSDWIELFNRSSNAPVALRDVYLSTSNALFQIRSYSFLPPRGYLQLLADETPGANHLEFKLPATGGAIALSDVTGTERDRVTYAAQTQAVSEGRLPDGAASITAFPSSASPGASNYLAAWNGPVLNEVLARNDRAEVSPWGGYADWIELYNPSNGVASVAGLALGSSTKASDRWTIPAGVTIPALGYLRIWCDGSRAASTSSGASLNSGFSLSGDSGDVYLFNAATQVVDSVSYGFQIQDVTIGRVSGAWKLLASPTPGAANAAAATLGSVYGLRVNEWMADPVSGNDWFELYNTNSLPVDLAGLYLTDDPSTTGMTNFSVAPLSFIAGRKWVLWQADGDPSDGRDHVNFNLDSLGETIRLYDTNLTLIDAADFGLQYTGASQGRLPDGATNFVTFATTASPGDANYLPITSVIINEVLTHTDSPLEDAVELYNPGGGSVNIGGWYLSDSQTDPLRYRIPDGTTIPAGGYKVFYQYQFGPADGETDTPPLFTFNSAHGDAVYLSQVDAGTNLTGYRASVSFAAAANGVSFGRYITSMGADFVAMSARTFGVDNPSTLTQFRTGTGATNAYPLVGPVVISQIMYQPADYGTNSPSDEEYIKLKNITASAVPLYDPAHTTNVWRLAGGVAFNFANTNSIPANGQLVVVPFNPVTDTNALATFRSRYGSGFTLVGPYSGKLNNAGDTVELWRPDAPQAAPHSDAGFVPQLLVERIVYSPVTPWPYVAGNGMALQRVANTGYGNDPVNWTAQNVVTNTPAPTEPKVSLGTAPAAGILRLNLTLDPGNTYQLQYKDNLTNAVWLTNGAPVTATNSLVTVDISISTPSQRYYRLVFTQ